MKIYVDNYGAPDNFSAPLQNAIRDLKDGDALTFDSEAPTDFVVDYVRAYQYNSLMG